MKYSGVFKTNKMKAQELRLGNYVSAIELTFVKGSRNIWIISQLYDRGDELSSIVARNIDASQLSTCGTSQIKPIPLTEEWLLKLGIADGFVFKDIEYFSLAKTNTGDDYYCVYFENEYTAVDIKYVHQLQNLYFALTGEELTIKEQ